ncbi:purine-nucleoside phosphorylase [Desulfovibrio legallii]|uniref:Purine nucleoside phosphorylase n=1 Tax=Desulfovibrio legallii TaxID=571438 RepID=A0A1G7QLG8_9BACT|nr:purine-nucleoside phosphorylase [Desulfovibrio legallii]SDF98749.1 purine-nucleoside phosphorylase [Desulfovibrio legallii]
MQNPQEVQRAAAELTKRLSAGLSAPALPAPSGADEPVGIVLGTGLSGLADKMADARAVPYDALPGFPPSSVASHSGAFLCGRFPARCGEDEGLGRAVIIQQGRCHLYEGRSPAEVCMGVRVMAGLGVRTLIVTNAAGALNPNFDAGSIMCMTDMINHTGVSPLTGLNCDAWGPRFPDMSEPFDPQLRDLAVETACKMGIRLERGVYIGVHGPEMETPAETRLYRQWGADAVGMSTVLEVIAARHLGLRVLGLSCLTNKNRPDCMAPVSLEEVIAAAQTTGRQLGRLIRALVTKL